MNIRRLVIASFLIAIAAWVAFAMYPSRSEIQFEGPTEIAVFSGGCFWGLQAAFNEVEGVVSSRVGYTGGDLSNPTYTKVVFEKTGHAEAVEVTFNPTIISFDELLQFHLGHVKPRNEAPSIDYDIHHSRAAVFVQSKEQRETAESATSDDRWQNKHVLVEAASTFWEAEAEHQNYLVNCVY